MGQTLVGIIPSKLTPEKIIDLPQKLNREKPLGIPDEVWSWEDSDISVDFLKDYWTWDEEWYINEVQNKRYDKIYKYPSIATNRQRWRILFFEPTLISISLPSKYYPKTLEDLQGEMEAVNAAIRLTKFFGQNTMLLTYELGSGTTQEETKGINFENLSNMVKSFKLAKREFKIIKF